jgi:hypothetical protein
MKKKLLIVLTLITVMMASVSLTRCGSGVGEGFDASANGVKY